MRTTSTSATTIPSTAPVSGSCPIPAMFGGEGKAAIGARIREARGISGMTQEQLAEKVDVNTTYISDIERGAKFPSLTLFIKIVDALGISSDFILRGEIEAGKKCVYDDITKKLENLTPKQRLGVANLIDAYIKNLE